MGAVFHFLNRSFGKLGNLFQSPILLLLRLFFGISFFFAGLSKIQDVSKFSDSLMTLNVPYPETIAWLVTFGEIVCGLLLTLGFLTRIITIPLIIIMLGAFTTAHFDTIAKFTDEPMLIMKQTAFSHLIASLVIFAFGPGFFSLDALIEKNSVKTSQRVAK